MAARRRKGLSAIGKKALADARSTYTHPSKRLDHAAYRYAHAVQREHELRAMWDDLGRPVITPSKGRDFIHPLLGEIRAAEAHAQQLAATFGLASGASKPRGMGRPQERVPPASGEPPKLVALPGNG